MSFGDTNLYEDTGHSHYAKKLLHVSLHQTLPPIPALLPETHCCCQCFKPKFTWASSGTSWQWNYPLCSFHGASCFWESSLLFHIPAGFLLPWYCWAALRVPRVCMDSPVDEYLCCASFLSFLNKATKNFRSVLFCIYCND